jgi:NAD(P)-dependent dehydrogenase (short-subunit alcohol dehydrogenase family)
VRTAIVTGAAGGLGSALVRRLVRDGLEVAIADLDTDAAEALAAELPGTFATHVDVTSPGSAEELAAVAIGRWGQIDVLVNNAGIQGLRAPVHELPVEDWRRVIDVNLGGTFNVTRACLPHMLERGSGRIVNVASIVGKEGNPYASAYSASKGGVIAFTKAVAKEVAGSGVLVNCIAPAVVDAGFGAQATDEERARYVSYVPLGRMGTADEFAAMVAWIASPECTFSNGAVFDLSGGRASY